MTDTNTTIYSNDLSTTILCNLISNSEYQTKALPHIKEEYFESHGPIQWTFKLLSAYVQKYNKTPTKEVLLVDLDSLTGISKISKQAFPNRNAATQSNSLKNNSSISPRPRTSIGYSMRLKNGCKNKAIYGALYKSIEILEKHGDLTQIPTLLQEALSVSFQDTTPLGEWDAGEDTEVPPPRGWLLGNVFCRKFMSSLIGDGGVGKTALRYAQLMSSATGIPLTGEHVFCRCRVLIVSLEDDADELRRRIAAILKHHKIDQAELKGWLFLSAPGGKGGKLMTVDARGRLQQGQLANNLEAIIVKRDIDIVSIDPFVKSHSVEENNNSAVDDVVQILTDLGNKYNIAVDAPHHTSKGIADPGNASRGRGASAMKDAARLVYTLTPMSAEEAKKFGVDEEERPSLVRMDSAKVNITPPLWKAKWFKLVGVKIGNANLMYQSGDEVQTVEPWSPPDLWEGLDPSMQERIILDIDNGLSDGIFYSDASNAGERAAWKIVQKHLSDKTEAQCREIIKKWVKDKILESFPYHNEKTRKEVNGLRRCAVQQQPPQQQRGNGAAIVRNKLSFSTEELEN